MQYRWIIFYIEPLSWCNPTCAACIQKYEVTLISHSFIFPQPLQRFTSPLPLTLYQLYFSFIFPKEKNIFALIYLFNLLDYCFKRAFKCQSLLSFASLDLTAREALHNPSVDLILTKGDYGLEIYVAFLTHLERNLSLIVLLTFSISNIFILLGEPLSPSMINPTIMYPLLIDT